MDSDSSILYESCTHSAGDVNLSEDEPARLAPLENCLEEFEETSYQVETQIDEFDQNPGGPLSIETHASDPIHEDFEVMGIENTWTDEDAFSGAAPPVEPFGNAIPLPPPPISHRDGVIPSDVHFDDPDYTTTSNDISAGNIINPHHELDSLFSSPSSVPTDIGLDDVKDPSACPGVCGIRNLGNTCFMSAGLQCLGATPALVQRFVNQQKFLTPLCSSLSAPISSSLSSASPAMSASSSLSSQYAALLTKMWSGRYTVVNPSEFKRGLGITHPQFKDFRQHDCQEFLALLLDTLHEELNTATAKKMPAFSSNFPMSPTPMLSSVPSGLCAIPSLSLPSNNLSNGSATRENKAAGWPKPFFWRDNKSSGISEEMDTSTNEEHSNTKEGSEEDAQKLDGEQNQEQREGTDGNKLFETLPVTPTFIRNETCVSGALEEPATSWNHCSPCLTPSSRRIEKNEVQAQQMSIEAKTHGEEIGQLRRTLPFPGALPIPSRGNVGIEDIMKEAKTSNVNVLASDSSNNGGMKFDSDKFIRRARRGVVECRGMVQGIGISSTEGDLSHNDGLSMLQDQLDGEDSLPVEGEVLSGKTKRVKDTNIVLRGVGGMSPLSESMQDGETDLIVASSKNPSEHFNNVKRMRLAGAKTQSYAKANGILGKSIGLIGCETAVLGKNAEVMQGMGDEMDGFDGDGSIYSLANKVTSPKFGVALSKREKTPSPTECVVDKIGSLNGLNGSFGKTTRITGGGVVGGSDGLSSLAEDDFSSTSDSLEAEEEEADRHWQKHLAANRSTIVDTFQGQFKSTVVCSACKHVSVTYEPFMYLSVPLPHAMERQICVTYISAEARQPVRYLLTLNKQGKVSEMRQQLYKILAEESKCNSPASLSSSSSSEMKNLPQDNKPDLALAEVLDNHIAKILDDNYLLRYVNDTNRSIYAFELRSPPPAFGVSPAGAGTSPLRESKSSTSIHTIAEPLDLTHAREFEGKPGCSGDLACANGSDDKRKDPVIVGGVGTSDGWRSCAICLEEMDTDLRVHSACSCVLCESCIETSCRHYGGDSLACPVCGQVVNPREEFLPLDKVGNYQPPAIRILQVPLVFRVDEEGDGNNNRKTMKLWGHPALLRLPSRIQAKDLYEAVEYILPSCLLSTHNQEASGAHPSSPSSCTSMEQEEDGAKYQLLLVDGQGYHCSRCMYTVHCRGCRLSAVPSAEITLQAGDTLAVRVFARDLSAIAGGESLLPLFENEVTEHRSMHGRWKEEPLSLYDCLQAFSESEMLDEHNPWFCPVCQRNQCATKTLSVWRYPDFLIVYLKRFVFHECVSTKLDDKVTFPLCGLHVAPPACHQSFSQSSNHCSQMQRQHHRGSPHPYNLYAAVCHFGGASAGHYTAYSKHPGTSEWHYFNDEAVSCQKPREEDYSNAYILFYHKQGLSFDLFNLPKKMPTEVDEEEDEEEEEAAKDLKPNIEQLILDLDSSVMPAEVDEEEDEEEEEAAKDLKPNIEQLILDLDSSVEQDWRKEQKSVGQAAMVISAAEVCTVIDSSSPY
ncbi:uncharacterized protein LOC124163729 [Ischnura elegans]|uniref:uncharacterized protein LOC124163729 n=1 Tax=Ischnura elegans TaxID=197161 RepID=UPI001ED8B047|nr:uncharacterized protein LOC124163729 [Ischnura elegans]